jgi:hypothetical protein
MEKKKKGEECLLDSDIEKEEDKEAKEGTKRIPANY